MNKLSLSLSFDSSEAPVPAEAPYFDRPTGISADTNENRRYTQLVFMGRCINEHGEKNDTYFYWRNGYSRGLDNEDCGICTVWANKPEPWGMVEHPLARLKLISLASSNPVSLPSYVQKAVEIGILIHDKSVTPNNAWHQVQNPAI